MALRPSAKLEAPDASAVYDLIEKTPQLARYAPILNRANASKIELIDHAGHAALKLYLEVGGRVYECIFKINKISDDFPALKAQADAINEAAMKALRPPPQLVELDSPKKETTRPISSMWSEARPLTSPAPYDRRLEDLSSSVAELSSEVSLLKSKSLTHAQTDVSDLATRLAETQALLASKEAQVSKLETEIAESKKLLERCNRELEALRSSHEVAISTLTSKHKQEVVNLHSDLRRQHISYTQTITHLQSRLQHMQRYCITLETRYREKIGALRADDKAIPQKVFRQWEGERQRLQSQIQSLKTMIISLQDTRDRHAEIEFEADLQTRMLEAMRLDSPTDVVAPKAKRYDTDLQIKTDANVSIESSSPEHFQEIAQLQEALRTSYDTIAALIKEKQDRDALTRDDSVLSAIRELEGSTNDLERAVRESLLPGPSKPSLRVLHQGSGAGAAAGDVESLEFERRQDGCVKRTQPILSVAREGIVSISPDTDSSSERIRVLEKELEKAKTEKIKIDTDIRNVQMGLVTLLKVADGRLFEQEEIISDLSTKTKFLEQQLGFLRKELTASKTECGELSKEKIAMVEEITAQAKLIIDLKAAIKQIQAELSLYKIQTGRRQSYSPQMTRGSLERKGTTPTPPKKPPEPISLDVTHATRISINPFLDLGDSWKPDAIEREKKGSRLLRSPVLALLSIGLFNKIKEAQTRAREASSNNTGGDPSDFADGGD
jgi:DNA repair exonuclease SbcCD ATPase subunit